MLFKKSLENQFINPYPLYTSFFYSLPKGGDPSLVNPSYTQDLLVRDDTVSLGLRGNEAGVDEEPILIHRESSAQPKSMKYCV